MSKFIKIVFVILSSLLWTIPASFAESLAGNSTNQGTPGVKGDNTAGGDGVLGNGGESGRGVVGTSNAKTGVEGDSSTGIGVYGTSASTGRGVVGVTKSNTAVEGDSESGVGVWGSTKGAAAAGAEFYNTGGGDLIRAGEGGAAFRVQNNGDVVVRGQKIGAKGDKGDKGDKGVPGAAGPAGPPGVHTVSICTESSGLGNSTCSCTSKTVSSQTGPCTVSSDTGSCSAAVNGCCAVCAP